jgi:hypothetical protein
MLYSSSTHWQSQYRHELPQAQLLLTHNAGHHSPRWHHELTGSSSSSSRDNTYAAVAEQQQQEQKGENVATEPTSCRKALVLGCLATFAGRQQGALHKKPANNLAGYCYCLLLLLLLAGYCCSPRTASAG